MPKLSITIVHHRNKHLLENCLDSIFRETKTDFEIILVDNCSNEGIKELIVQKYPKIRLIENDHPAGFASNQNKALKIADGNFILVLNDDTVILDSAIDKMIKFMEKNPSIGLLGCKMYNSDKSVLTSPSKYPVTPIREFFETFMGLSGIRKYFPESSFLYSLGCGDFGPNAADREGDVAHIIGACMLARKEVVEQVELLDENYFMFVEETDWCHRIRQKGWRIYYYPSSHIIHYGASSLSFLDTERRKLHEKSLDYFFRKHYGRKGLLLHKSLRILLCPFRIMNTIIKK